MGQGPDHLPTKAMSAVFLSVGGPDHEISVNGQLIKFEMHPWSGPTLLNSKGDPCDNQQYDHPFWEAVSWWAQQGKRTENGLCIWDHPSEPITKHIGGKNYLVIGHTEPRRGN